MSHPGSKEELELDLIEHNSLSRAPDSRLKNVSCSTDYRARVLRDLRRYEIPAVERVFELRHEN